MESFFERVDAKKRVLWKTVKNYNIMSPDIGKGDSTFVYLCEDKDKKTNIAMKVYSSLWIYDNESVLLNEINGFETLYSMGLSPQMLCYPLRTPNNIYLPLELCNCGSLESYIKSKGAIPESIIKDVITFLAGALDKLNKKGKMLREINPKHILAHMDDKKKICYKLIGLQFFRDLSKDKPDSLVGNVAFSAPETATGKPYDASADIWSVGVSLYQLATGVLPTKEDPDFVGSVRKGKGLTFPDESKLSDALRDLINKCICFDPTKRPTPLKILDHPFIKGDALPMPISPIHVKPHPPPPEVKLGVKTDTELQKLVKDDFHKYMEYVIIRDKKQHKMKAEKKDELYPYEVTDARPICRGGFSEIYLCTNKETQEKFVLKKVLTSKMVDLKVANLLLGEIEIMQEIRHSPFTIKLEDYFVHKNDLCLIIEYCNGGDLDNYVREYRRANKGKFLPIEELKLIAWNIACGLRDMHARNLMHRDIKPKNILVIKDEKGKLVDIKLCDYGLSRQMDEGVGEASTILGTQDYFAPELYFRMEQMMGGAEDVPKYTNKVDVWSYGVLLFFVAFGKTLFESPGSKFKVLKQKQIAYPSTEGISEGFINVIKACLDYDPVHRPSFCELLHYPFFTIVEMPVRSSLSPYKLGEKIGESRNGKNKIHKITKGKEELAVKITRLTGVNQKMLCSEIDTLVKLRNSENIVPLYDHFTVNDDLYLVMKLYTGGDLEKYIFEREKAKNPLPVSQQTLLAYSVLKGISEIHSHKMIHRDIHPRNILICTDPSRSTILEAAVCDFGFARVLLDDEEALTRIGSYKSPELMSPKPGQTHDSSTDIWSYGMLLYFIIFGMHADTYVGNVMPEVYKTGVFKYPATRKNVPAELLEVMKLCTKILPANRPVASKLLELPVFKAFETSIPG